MKSGLALPRVGMDFTDIALHRNEVSLESIFKSYRFCVRLKPLFNGSLKHKCISQAHICGCYDCAIRHLCSWWRNERIVFSNFILFLI
jgi:hypothetical protein